MMKIEVLHCMQPIVNRLSSTSMGVLNRSQLHGLTVSRQPFAIWLWFVITVLGSTSAWSQTDAAVTPPRADVGPVATSSNGHIWAFEPRMGDGRRINVLHHGPGMHEGEMLLAFVLEEPPEAAIAVDRSISFSHRAD